MGAIYSLISRCALLKIVKPWSKCGNCRLCTAKCTMGIDLAEKKQTAGGACIGCGVCVNGCPKNNAHWKYRYSVWIGVGVTCLTIAASQFLIRSESGSVGKTAGDAAIDTAEQNLDSRFRGRHLFRKWRRLPRNRDRFRKSGTGNDNRTDDRERRG